MMLPPQGTKGVAPRGVCWAWRKGFCARGPDCIYRHEERSSTRSDNRICRWEYATRCRSRGGCGQKHLQLTISGVAPRLDYFRSFGRNRKDLTQRDLAELLRVAIGLFVDGDQELRFLIVSTISSGWHLQQMKLCLHPNFLFQPYPPQISWQDHVVPLLRIMSDPVNTIHEPSMESLRSLYEVALDPRRRDFWMRVMKFIGDSSKLYPFCVASHITGVITILLLAIKFDEQNLKNLIVRESVPLLVEHLGALQGIYRHGYLSPALSEALNALKHTVSGRLSVVDALTTVTSKARRGDRVSGSNIPVSGGAQDEEEIGEVFCSQKDPEIPAEPLERRLLTFATENLMTGYLQGLSGHTVNGGLIAGMGFIDDNLENQAQTEKKDLEDGLQKIPYSHAHHGGIDIRPNPVGQFSAEPRKNVAKPMAFTNDYGDALFQRWKNRAADPAKLNFDWGKHSNTNSMKDFLQLTLALFVTASTETRLQFISEYLLKDEYLGKLWECLSVKLPTDSINHPSPKYSDHVSTIIRIMSHPDVVNRREFQAVRKELSGMFVSVPNYLYGIVEYMKLRSRNKAKNTEMIETCVNSVILILEGVFKLIDPRNIPMEFRYEAKEFIKFAISMENATPWAIKINSLTTEAVQSFMRADEKLFLSSNPLNICSGRQADQAQEQAHIASGAKIGHPTATEMNKNISDRIKSGNIIRPVNSYLDENAEETKRKSRRERGRYRRRKDDEEGWDDGKPIIHRADYGVQDEQKPAEEIKQEFEEEAQPMNDEQALQYLEKIKSRPNTERVPETELSSVLDVRVPLGERDLGMVDEFVNSRTFGVQGALNQAIGEEPFRSNGGSVPDESRSVSVKTCSRFPRQGINSVVEPLYCGEPDSSGSPPKGASVLNYMSSRDAPVLLGRAILERLSATPDVAQSPIKELQNGKSSHGRHVSELAVPTWTNEQKDAPESQDKFAAERASGPKKAEPWPLSNRSAQFQLIEEGWQTPEPLAPLRTTDVKFGLHPRDKVTADYYQAIHGTGYPSFHLDKSGGAGGFEPQRSVLQLEGHGKNRMGLSLLAHQACPPEDPHLAGQKNKSQVLFVEQAVYSPYEEGDSSKVPEGSGEQGSQLADSKIGDLQYTPINQLSHKKTMGHEQRRAIAPPAKGPQNQGTIGDIGETTASTNLTPSRHRVALSPRPLATSNKDRVIWPNVQLEAAEAERGRPITRLTNRHDQDLLPRRLSAIRNTNDVKEYLPCGHTRGLNRNETYCNERVNKKTPYCGHEANVECSNPMKRWQCKIVCGAHLPCAHYCARECFQCLHEIKIDGTPIWNHHPCHVCMNIRAAEEKRKGLRREVNQHAANVADRA